jgi:hypothetical protein
LKGVSFVHFTDSFRGDSAEEDMEVDDEMECGSDSGAGLWRNQAGIDEAGRHRKIQRTDNAVIVPRGSTDTTGPAVFVGVRAL